MYRILPIALTLMACTIENNNKLVEPSLSLDSVTISPDTGITNDSLLTCIVSVSEFDGEFSTSFEWLIGTTMVGEGDTVDLSAVAAVPGDEATCIANVTDSSGVTATGNTSVIVENREAIINELTLSPELVLTNDTITATATSSDPDILQTLTASYEWHVITAATGDDNIVQTGSSNTLDGTSHFDRDDTVYVVVTPNDGFEDGVPTTSNDLTIYNSAPTPPTVQITPSPAYSINNLTCQLAPPSTDADEDTITYNYKWFVDGVETPNSTDTVDATQTSFGETWLCLVTPSDGTIQGDSNSASITITDYDSDGDGVFDSNDLCDGYDDTIDLNSNGLPDDCEVTTVFYYTGNIQTFDIPNDTSSIFIQAYGAKGGDGDVNGGLGGMAESTIPVIPGETLEIYVGGAGSNHNSYGAGGFNGGGDVNECCGSSQLSGTGGGASDVRIAPYSLNDRIIVAGGGGGGGTANWGAGSGGAGGGLDGQDGTPPSITTNSNVREGTGGTQTTGGIAFQCCGNNYPNEDGSFGQGGSCWHDSASCGAGGGGWYGGGAGSFAPGGGGSSYIGWPDATNTSTTSGVQSGDGQIIITYLMVP